MDPRQYSLTLVPSSRFPPPTPPPPPPPAHHPPPFARIAAYTARDPIYQSSSPTYPDNIHSALARGQMCHLTWKMCVKADNFIRRFRAIWRRIRARIENTVTRIENIANRMENRMANETNRPCGQLCVALDARHLIRTLRWLCSPRFLARSGHARARAHVYYCRRGFCLRRFAPVIPTINRENVGTVVQNVAARRIRARRGDAKLTRLNPRSGDRPRRRYRRRRRAVHYFA